nr:MAG TPA: hypothetical protein [Caudoviricetes sp.]
MKNPGTSTKFRGKLRRMGGNTPPPRLTCINALA